MYTNINFSLIYKEITSIQASLRYHFGLQWCPKLVTTVKSQNSSSICSFIIVINLICGKSATCQIKASYLIYDLDVSTGNMHIEYEIADYIIERKNFVKYFPWIL